MVIGARRTVVAVFNDFVFRVVVAAEDAEGIGADVGHEMVLAAGAGDDQLFGGGAVVYSA